MVRSIVKNLVPWIIGVAIGRRALALARDDDGVAAGLGVERDFAAAGHANGLGDAGNLSLAEAGEAPRLALVGHAASLFPARGCHFLIRARIAFDFGSFGTF